MSTLQLTIQNTPIPLREDISLPLTLRSPLFVTGESRIQGGYIFNTTFPASETLRSLFDQAHRPTRHGRATAELPYVLRLGSLRYEGYCNVAKSDADNYEIAFRVDNGDLASRLKDKTLKDLDLGGDNEISSVHQAMARTTEHHEYSEWRDTEFEVDWVPAMDIIMVDTGMGFSSGAASYTIPKSGSYLFHINFDVELVVGTIIFQLLINDVVVLPLYLYNESITWNFAFDATISDVVTFNMHCYSNDSGGMQTILFTMRNGSFIQFTENNSDISGNSFDQVLEPGMTAKQRQLEHDYVAFPIMNEKFLDSFPDDAFELDNLSIKTLYTNYFKVLNYYDGAKFPLFMQGEVDGEYVIAANLFTPFVYMRTLLVKIATDAGYQVVNNPFETDMFAGAVLFNAYADNMYSSNITTLLPFKSTFNLEDHVPAMPQNDFLNWVSVLTGMMPVVDNRSHTITFIDVKTVHIPGTDTPPLPFPGQIVYVPEVNIEPEYKGIKLELKAAGPDNYVKSRIREINEKMVYKGEVEHINNLPPDGNEVNDYYLVTNLNEFYVWQYNPEVYALTWWFYSKKFPLIYREGSEPYLEISTQFCPVLTSKVEDITPGAPDDRYWTIPRTEQVGILEGFPESFSEEYGTQVLIFKGMVNDSLNSPYPLATCRMANYGNVELETGDINATDVFGERYKEFLQWLAYETHPVTLRAVMGPGQLSQLQWGRIYQANGMSFLVKEVRANIRIDGLSIVEMDVYTC